MFNLEHLLKEVVTPSVENAGCHLLLNFLQEETSKTKPQVHQKVMLEVVCNGMYGLLEMICGCCGSWYHITCKLCLVTKYVFYKLTLFHSTVTEIYSSCVILKFESLLTLVVIWFVDLNVKFAIPAFKMCVYLMGRSMNTCSRTALDPLQYLFLVMIALLHTVVPNACVNDHMSCTY